ncbi:cupin domain-containing protein [Streptomyces boncukensis]|uniref:Cupin domain-containing protein n=1 Tax=Streptomyces boncukensis TaxID=2711219 RepID=A0A6G4X889_9ACTN|nr:cupin domain-containing protein [Streptomyces boncukensis]
MALHYGLEPLPVEGGRFRATWTGPSDATGRPVGTAIMVLLTDAPDDFSAMHRLPTDEVWHFYRGDPLELLLLAPDGGSQVLHMGGADGSFQTVVPAGTWMGARVAPGGNWSLFGTTMAPGFLPTDYEGGTAEELCAGYPGEADRIRALCRPDMPLHMPDEIPPPGSRGDTTTEPHGTSDGEDRND